MPHFEAVVPTGTVAQKDGEGEGLGERKQKKKKKKNAPPRKIKQNTAESSPSSSSSSSRFSKKVPHEWPVTNTWRQHDSSRLDTCWISDYLGVTLAAQEALQNISTPKNCSSWIKLNDPNIKRTDQWAEWRHDREPLFDLLGHWQPRSSWAQCSWDFPVLTVYILFCLHLFHFSFSSNRQWPKSLIRADAKIPELSMPSFGTPGHFHEQEASATEQTSHILVCLLYRLYWYKPYVSRI